MWVFVRNLIYGSYKNLKLVRKHTQVVFLDRTTSTSLLSLANLKFACLTKANIRAYAATKEPFDKARACHFQGVGEQLVERLDKEFFTVIGLPMHRFSQEISVTTESLNTYLRLQ